MWAEIDRGVMAVDDLLHHSLYNWQALPVWAVALHNIDRLRFERDRVLVEVDRGEWQEAPSGQWVACGPNGWPVLCPDEATAQAALGA